MRATNLASVQAYLDTPYTRRLAARRAFYGIEAVMKDGVGNWFSMTQPKEWKAD